MSTRTPEAVAAILDDYRAGLRMKDISAKHGLGVESIRVLARRAGIEKRDLDTHRCSSCHGMRRRLDAEGLCDTCAEEIPLNQGRWVRDGLVMRWQKDPEAKPIGDLIACPKCGAKVTETCRTKGGHRSNPHAERLTPRLCRCGHLPKPRGTYCERCLPREGSVAA